MLPEPRAETYIYADNQGALSSGQSVPKLDSWEVCPILSTCYKLLHCKLKSGEFHDT